jgi:hypothetical protein
VIAGVAAIDLARIFSIVPIAAWSLFDGRPEILLRLALAVALIMLGPGAHSVDAYLFGRREIVFPQA